MPGRFELKPTLAKIWHAPDHFRILDPLPSLHRKGLILAFVLVVAGILLPSGDNTPPSSTAVGREAQLDIQSQSQPTTPVLTAPSGQSQPSAPLVNEPQQNVPLEPEPVQEQPQEEVSAPQRTATSSAGGIEQQWRSYRVGQGKTLAQVFRDHNLPPTDVYAMAKVEGDGKPLSTLQSGQMVKIRQNANGVVTGLTIEGSNGQSALFTRQQDGSFIRAR
ncbi:LysM-like peptidoglycan-binding domain-containing protein [Phytobacter sp. V91]|uniref:LysM-like peptidoglycan-binding domain-containing protein n=1 Tax=Phytobacter sp. V91 TaxID=3369425 RepID=UPI003F5D9B02